MDVEKESPEARAEVDRLWREMRGGPFEAAVRERFGVDSTWIVNVEESGGEQVQIGDMTWDTAERAYEVTATQLKLDWFRDRYFWGGTLRPRLVPSRSGARKSFKCGSVPEIWEWLSEEKP